MENVVDGTAAFLGDDDLSDVLTGESQEGSTASDFSPDKPHWKLDKKELTNVLKIAGSFPSKSTVFFSLRYDAGRVVVFASNKDAVLEAHLEILNDSPYTGKKNFFLDMKLFYNLVNSYGVFALSFDEADEIYYENPYSQVKLESYSLDLEELLNLFQGAPKKMEEFPLRQSEVSSIKALFSVSAKLDNSKIRFCEDFVEVFYTLFLYRVKLPAPLPENFILRKIDIAVLENFLQEKVSYALTESRVYFESPSMLLSFLRLPYNEKEFGYSPSFAVGEEKGSCSLDNALLRRSLRLVSLLNQTVVEFFQEEGRVKIQAGRNAQFDVGTGSLVEPFILSSEIIARIIQTVNLEHYFLQVKVAEHGLDITLDSGGRSITYSLSKLSVSQYDREQKVTRKKESRKEAEAKLQEAGKFCENFQSEGSLFEAFQKGDY